MVTYDRMMFVDFCWWLSCLKSKARKHWWIDTAHLQWESQSPYQSNGTITYNYSFAKLHPWRALAIDPGQAKCVGSGSLRWVNLDRYCPPHAHERLLATLMCCWCHLQIWCFLVVLHIYIYMMIYYIYIYSHRAQFCLVVLFKELVTSYESNHVKPHL